ncbi:MAG: hypothetical protein JXQ93_11260 [Flavobacteriaceae bacterium]
MKKYIYKVKLIIVAALVLTSCAVDDDDPTINPIGNIEASLNSPLIRIGATDATYDLTVSLSNALPTSAQVDYTLDGVDLVARGDQGNNFITITVDMSTSLFRTVSLKDIIMFYASAQNLTVTVSETNYTSTIVRGNDDFAVMTWGNNVDIDLLMTAAPAPNPPFDTAAPTTPIVGLSILVVPEEVIIFPGGLADGDYSLSIVPYAAFNTPIEFTLTVVGGTSASTITGTVDSGLAAGGFFNIVYNTIVEFGRVTKSGTEYTVVNQI